MNRPEVLGVPLERFVDPIRIALHEYAQGSRNGAVTFEDIDAAAQLTLTPDKPNSARSQTRFLHDGEVAGDLFVIAFAPGDGTGDENTFALEDIRSLPYYPDEAKVVPRSKAGTYREVHLALAAQKLDDVHADPALFVGDLALLGFPEVNNPFGNQIGEIGRLGGRDFELSRVSYEYGVATATVWDIPMRDGSREYKRKGDPHAVYNPYEDRIQICAFVAIKDAEADAHGKLTHDLYARTPDTRDPLELVEIF